MKTYIQPTLEIQTIAANAIVCASVTQIKSSVVTLKGESVETTDAR